MKRFIGVIIFCLLFVFYIIGELHAQVLLAYGTPEIFRLTVKYLGVSYDNGATYYALYNDSTGITQDYGSSSVLAGQKINDLSLTTDLPEGTINKMKMTIAPYITYKGNITYGDHTYYTPTASNVSPDLNPEDMLATTNSVNYGTITNCYRGITPADVTNEGSCSVEIDSGTNTLKLSNNATNAIVLYQAGPNNIITLSIEFSLSK